MLAGDDCRRVDLGFGVVSTIEDPPARDRHPIPNHRPIGDWKRGGLGFHVQERVRAAIAEHEPCRGRVNRHVKPYVVARMEPRRVCVGQVNGAHDAGDLCQGIVVVNLCLLAGGKDGVYDLAECGGAIQATLAESGHIGCAARRGRVR
jgi:hypothetical protein